MTSDIRIIKRKATGFFKSVDLPTVRKGIGDVNTIITNASILLRAYYLRELSEYKKSEEAIIIDDRIVNFACSVVQGVLKPPLRGENKSNLTLTKLYEKLVVVKNDVFGDTNYTSDLSLSHVLNYSIQNLVTAYENNVTTNFIKYPKRVMFCHLVNEGMDAKKARRISAIIASHYFYDTPIESVDGKVDSVDPRIFVEFFPKKQTAGKPRVYDIKRNPWTYLRKTRSAVDDKRANRGIQEPVQAREMR
jgi:hypothetical protein